MHIVRKIYGLYKLYQFFIKQKQKLDYHLNLLS